MLLTANKFDIDIINEFPHLQDAATCNSAYFHIYTYEETTNTHACMENMRSHFLSESYNKKTMDISKNILKMLKYTGACSSRFLAHCTSLVKYYNAMSKQGEYYNDNVKVKQLHDSITVDNNSEIAVAKGYMLTNHRHHLKDSVTYMTKRMNEIIPDEGKTAPSSKRRISQVTVSGNIGGTHVPAVFNISNDIWRTFGYPGRQKVYRIRDSQHPGGQGHERGIFHSQRGRGGRGVC